ncbi:MAG: hypothetical protein V4819_24275 [Verrucomicrobiota bacterium]
MRSLFITLALCVPVFGEPIQLSGIYPSLAMYNNEGECGTGAVVPWADRLWVVTYAPHAPQGSSDKLYEITPDLQQIIRPESIGGTPANRMIHDESNQLFIGPYVIDGDAKVRTISWKDMYGRHTGNARSLTDPNGKILYATMEEGIYEVDVKTLEPKELWADEQVRNDNRKADLPGYHGKGFYSGQGVYVYANNGDHSRAAISDPAVPSGVLSEWDGKADSWTIIRRNQFTEVTGPSGIHGSKNPAKDPIWAVGWDFKSLLLGVRKADTGWTFHRLPKGSHSYDGAHGWNTEWPRIREIGDGDFMMTMHGTFWKFPRFFGVDSASGIRPRSNYLKVIGDFCRWNDRLIFGCDDTAKAEFLNKRKAKGEIAAPQSQSNLWFVKPDSIDHLGPAIGRGAVWIKEDIAAGTISDPYLFAGYDQRGLHLSHASPEPVTFVLETSSGDGKWITLANIDVPANSYQFVPFDAATPGEWIRVSSKQAVKQASAIFTYRNKDPRDVSPDSMFEGIAKAGSPVIGGLLRARDENKKTLSFASVDSKGKDSGYYELDADVKLRPVGDSATLSFTRQKAAIPTHVLQSDAGSVIYTDDNGSKWRFPKGDPAYDNYPLGDYRVAREISTERDLLNIQGSFYELPANNAGGVAKTRPVATHNRLVHDLCSYRGMLVISGIDPQVTAGNPHIIRSGDSKAAVWAGAIDDLWKFGKPRGEGGPWKDTPVKAGVPSDPYLMTAYDEKSLKLTSEQASAQIIAQVDLTGDGQWVDYKPFIVKKGEAVEHQFPREFSAYWIRFISDRDTTASAILTYR